MNDLQLQTYLRELKGLKDRLSSFALNSIAVFAVRRKSFNRRARGATAENAKKMKKKN